MKITQRNTKYKIRYLNKFLSKNEIKLLIEHFAYDKSTGVIFYLIATKKYFGEFASGRK